MKTLRAFTLIEVTLGLAMALIVISIAMSTAITALDTQRQNATKMSATADAQVVMDTMSYDFRFLGVGIPRGQPVDKNPVPPPSQPDTVGVDNNPNEALRPVFRRARSDAFVFTGDLPYPNADINGMMRVVAVRNGNKLDGISRNSGQHRIALSSEVSGCTPPSGSPGSYVCATHQRTMLQMGTLTGADACTPSNAGARTCPWAMRKWQEDDDGLTTIVIGDPNGQWALRAVQWSSGTPETDDVGVFTGVHLEHGVNSISDDEDLPETFFFPVVGSSFASQPDRVFYVLEEPDGTYPCTSQRCTLRRRQCWGEAYRPNDPGFPASGSAAVTSADNPDGCTPPQSGTPWESVMDGIASMEVRYFDHMNVEMPAASGLSRAQMARAMAVQVDLVVRRRVFGTTRELEQKLTKRFSLPNSGGIIGFDPTNTSPAAPVFIPTPANGGCVTDLGTGATSCGR